MLSGAIFTISLWELGEPVSAADPHLHAGLPFLIPAWMVSFSFPAFAISVGDLLANLTEAPG